MEENQKDTYGIEVGDKVRFVCHKEDEDGRPTDKIMRVTGVCTEIEMNHQDSPHFPKFHVRRNGNDYWYYGDNIQLIKKGNKKFKKHGMSSTPTYISWAKMKTRCYTKSSTEYKSHGERGIIVCDTWKDSFINFLNDMGISPGKGYSIDRINNDGNYEPGNCRWATHYQQCRNKRSNVWLILRGKTMCIKDWGNALGIDYRTISKRLKLGWSQEKALTSPLRKKKLH